MRSSVVHNSSKARPATICSLDMLDALLAGSNDYHSPLPNAWAEPVKLRMGLHSLQMLMQYLRRCSWNMALKQRWRRSRSTGIHRNVIIGTPRCPYLTGLLPHASGSSRVDGEGLALQLYTMRLSVDMARCRAVSHDLMLESGLKWRN